MADIASVFITGCSDGGIGSSLALSFVQRGYRVFAASRNVANMSRLQNLDNVTLVELDLEDTAQFASAVELVHKQTGGTLSYLVNNAGQNRFMPLLDENIDDIKRLYLINTFGPLMLVQAFAPLLISGKGTVVFTSSVSGWINVPWQGVYAASKRSTEVLADVLRLELTPLGVKTITVVTCAVESNVHNRWEEWEMPADSRYAVVKSDFTKRAKGDDGAPRMPVQKYADGVVSKIVAGSGPKFWYGAGAAFLKVAIAWLPTWLLDNLLAKGTGIDRMLKGNLP